MKKFIAFIIAFIASLANNTSYTVTEDKPYTEEYYKIDVADDPDYRQYYGTTSSVTSDTYCKVTNFSAQGKKVTGSDGYWFVNNLSANMMSIDANYCTEHHLNNNSSKPIDYYTCSGCFTDGNYIIMPYTGTLECDSKTNDCSSMTVYCTADTGVQYKLVFMNMDRWYCDIGRVEDPTYHTSDEQRGKKFQGGNVLGQATSDTTVKIIPIRNGASIGTATLSEFYSGTYTPN